MPNNHTNISPVKRLFLLLKPDKKEIRNLYVYAVFSGLVSLSLPLGIQTIINLIQGGNISTSWFVLVIFVILGIIIGGVLQINQLRITENLQQKIFTRAAFEFTFRIPRIKLESLINYYAPELMNRFFDVVSVQKGLSKVLIGFSTASVQVVFGLILLSLYHPFFIGFSIVLIVLVYVIFKLTAKKGLETSLKESKSKYELAHWLEEVARTGTTFKLAGHTDLPLQKTNEKSARYIDRRENHFKILIQQYGLMIGFKVIVAAGLLILGSILVIEQQMNIGQFVAAEIIILLIIGSIEKLISSLESIYDLLTSLEKIGQVTDFPLENHEGMNLEEVCGGKGMGVDLNKIHFKYPDEEDFLFNGASLSIKANEKVAITGDNSSGKATLLYLIAGLYPLNRGTICFNDIPLENLNKLDLRSVLGDCLNDELLFDGTLRENISMGRENADMENIKWAIKHVGLSEFVKSLPKGYDTRIQPEGQQFSKSVRDKLILARSIADQPKVLLIKDIFNTMKPSDKERIVDFLTDPAREWTLIIASQDQYVQSKVNRVIAIENAQFKQL